MDKVIIDKAIDECDYFQRNYGFNCYKGKNCNEVDDCYYKQLKRAKTELKKYEDMAKKGLEEFKDVGGCWGCGLQLQLNQDIEDIKKLKAENEELKKELEKHKSKIGHLLSPLTDSDFQDKLKELEQENERLKQESEQLHNDLKECGIKREQYRKALEDIRGIVFQAEQKLHCVCDITEMLLDIIDKINEVIGAE